MKSELEDRLAEKFEFMRIEHSRADGNITNSYYAIGIDIGDGWYELLYDMCREIAEVLKTAQKPIHIVVEQIKEKFGTLRFYYHIEQTELEIQAFDYMSSGSTRIKPKRDNVYQKISKIVEKYEDKSAEVCEICGYKGTLRTEHKWIQTLCETCYSNIR